MSNKPRNAQHGGVNALAIIFPAITLFTTMQLSTQWLADRWLYQAALGEPLFRIGDIGVYPFYEQLVWAAKFINVPGASQDATAALTGGLLGGIVLSIGAKWLGGLVGRRAGAEKEDRAYSSTYADLVDLELSGFLVKDAWATNAEIAAYNNKKKGAAK